MLIKLNNFFSIHDQKISVHHVSTRLHCLVMEGDVCKQLNQSHYIKLEWPRVEPTNSLL